MKLLILSLVIIIILILIASFYFRSTSQNKPTASSVPTPSPSSEPGLIPVPTFTPSFPPTPNPTQISETLTREELISKTPIVTKEYDIEYFRTSDYFLITIKESPYEQNRQKALTWLKERGLNPDEISVEFRKFSYVE